MNDLKIQQVWNYSYAEFSEHHIQSQEQLKTSHAIRNCKTGMLGATISQCTDCGHIEYHNHSCRNRNCPNCQAVKKELWVDKRRAEVIDSPYFHVVFTLPHELNPLLYHNQKLLYGLLHRCCAETLLELSADKKYLGATPGIIQVLHTWNQTLDYHVHMHCIVSGGGITTDGKIRKSKGKFFVPVFVLRDKFKGKFLYHLNALYQSGILKVPFSLSGQEASFCWNTFKDSLYQKDWCPYIKETFNGFGNAIEYLGRYTHKVAISNSRIISVTDTHTTFTARGRKPGDPRRTISLSNEEFIRRFLMHVLPTGFQKVRYYGFLNNRMKSKNLKLIFKLQGYQKFKQRYAGLGMRELLKQIWKKDICCCPQCGHSAMRLLGRTHGAFG